MKKTLTLATALVLTLGGVAAAQPASAGCASYPGATVVKCVQDTPKPTKAQKKAAKKQFKKALKRLSIVWTTR